MFNIQSIFEVVDAIYPSIYLTIYLSIYLSIYLFIYLSIYLPIYLSKRKSKEEVIDQWLRQSLCEKCPNTELFLVRIFQHSVRIREIQTWKNSTFGHFSHSECNHKERRIAEFTTNYLMLQHFIKLRWWTFY